MSGKTIRPFQFKNIFIFSHRRHRHTTHRGCNVRVVIGYTGGGGSTYWKKPIFNKVENGEIRDYGEKIIKTIKSYNRNWVKHTSRQRKKLSETYSEENEIKSLKKFMKQALKFF